MGVVAPASIPGARRAAMPRKIKPQLATLADAPPKTGKWISEIKFDGYRMLARIDAGKVEIISRNGLSWTTRFPGLAASLAKLKVKQAWLDGEVVALDSEGRSNFSKLKEGLGDEGKADVHYYLFDVLYLDGYDLTGCRQDDRKKALQPIIGTRPPRYLAYSQDVADDPAELKKHACQMKLEGIIVKRADATYEQKRSANWLKLKCVQREEFVVVGFTPPQGSRSGFGALLMGYYDPKGALHYAGGVGTGFNAKALSTIHQTLRKQALREPPKILVHGEKPPRGTTWVKPSLIAETQFFEWTPGGTLRHSTFLGLREDKSPREVVREPPAAVMPGAQSGK